MEYPYTEELCIYKDTTGGMKMSLDKAVIEIMEKQLDNGLIEKAISEKLEEGIKNAVNDMFCSYGDATKLIKEQIKSVLMPQLEDYDYSQHIVKLDSVLTEILKVTTVENKQLLENFKDFMIQPEEKEIKLSELFDRYVKFLEEDADTDDLTVNTDDGEPHYEGFDASYEVDHNEDRDWSCFKYATLAFENEHKDDLNFEVRLSRYEKNEGWDIAFLQNLELKSLRRTSQFSILLMNLDQCGVKLIIDKEYGGEEVFSNKEPECTYEFH